MCVCVCWYWYMDALHGRQQNVWRKSLLVNTQECSKQYWTSPGGSTQKQQLYSHLPPITETIKIRRTRHAVHCWRSKGELICDLLLLTPSHGQAKAGRPARAYIHQLYVDTGCIPEDLPEAMDYRKRWQERVKNSATWWWWWIR